MLKPQDIVVLLKVHCLGDEWTYQQLAESIKASSSVVYEALKRCEECHLYNTKRRRILNGALLEFLEHGLKYVFPAKGGALVRGVPTAHSAKPLKDLLMTNDNSIYVWASGKGKVKGQEIIPLYRSVPDVINGDREFYELLSLVDSLRIGKRREIELAIIELDKRLNG
ncbi:hypothetical protein Cyast_1811 [Cyanobacterium stanieri PCC 7202]|uniref:Uncharacterized protein n=1 Tax=Cyanobacterium stanieri (strain ATCC 29140 / PCC 7202) TaxID=292563 RepID=K9YMS6_CYASC|nr:hypothetical protein Cyast_1811 [Cyanobacterium stanieri PCC 7202]